MAIRICTTTVPRFMHGGLEVGEFWSEIRSLTDEQRATLRDFHGRFIRIHSSDLSKLSELGLRFEDESTPLVELPKGRPLKESKHAAVGGAEKRSD